MAQVQNRAIYLAIGMKMDREPMTPAARRAAARFCFLPLRQHSLRMFCQVPAKIVLILLQNAATLSVVIAAPE